MERVRQEEVGTGQHRISRRLFCCGVGFGMGSLLLVSCSRLERIVRKVGGDHVFKYPENADQIADFWDVFADRNFNADKAINSLKLTGTPDTRELPKGSETVYGSQNDLIQGVRFTVHDDRIVELHLTYARAVRVIVDDLSAHFPSAPRMPGTVGSISMPQTLALIAANTEPRVKMQGTPSNGRLTYAVRAMHTTDNGPTTYGNIELTAEANDPASNVGRDVWEIAFIKSA